MADPTSSASDASVTHPVWTLPSLAAYLEVRLRDTEKFEQERDRRYTELTKEMERRVEQKFASVELSFHKYEGEVREWRANSNEWRGAMDDREDNLLSKAEAKALFDGLRQQIDALGSRVDTRMVAVEQRSTDQQRALDRLSAERRGIKDAWGYLLGAATLIGVVVAIVLSVRS